MENRNALIVDAALTRAGGMAEREAALAMLDRRRRRGRRITLAADKAYDVRAFIEGVRAHRVTPHIAIDGNVRVNGTPRRTAIDKRNDPAPGLRREPARSQAHRGRLRLDQDHRQSRQNPPPGPQARRLGLHTHRRSLQPGANTKAPARNMSPALHRTPNTAEEPHQSSPDSSLDQARIRYPTVSSAAC